MLAQRDGFDLSTSRPLELKASISLSSGLGMWRAYCYYFSRRWVWQEFGERVRRRDLQLRGGCGHQVGLPKKCLWSKRLKLNMCLYSNLPVRGPAIGTEEKVTRCAHPRRGPLRAVAAHDRLILCLPECLDDGSEGEVRRKTVDTFVKSRDHSTFGAFHGCRASS